jgi:thioredoxin-related protein
MVKYNRILLNYLRGVMSEDAFAVYMDFIGEGDSEDTTNFDEFDEEENEENKEE